MKRYIYTAIFLGLTALFIYSCQEDAHGVDPYVIEERIDKDTTDPGDPGDINKYYLYADYYEIFVNEATMDDNNPIITKFSADDNRIKFDTTDGKLNLIIDDLVLENPAQESTMFQLRDDRLKKMTIRVDSEPVIENNIFVFSGNYSSGNYISVVLQKKSDKLRYEIDNNLISAFGIYDGIVDNGNGLKNLQIYLNVNISDMNFETRLIGVNFSIYYKDDR